MAAQQPRHRRRPSCKLGDYEVLARPNQPDPDDSTDTSDDAGKSPVVQDDGTTAWEAPSGGETRTVLLSHTATLTANFADSGVALPSDGDLLVQLFFNAQSLAGTAQLHVQWFNGKIREAGTAVGNDRQSGQIDIEVANRRFFIAQNAAGNVVYGPGTNVTGSWGITLTHIT